MNRRDFLKGAGAAIVPAALPGAIWAAPPLAPESGSAPPAAQHSGAITAVVFDDRYPDCRLFAAALARLGAVAFATNSDATRLWYGPLRAHLAQYPGRVAGLTAYADFSVSQACGRELGFAPIFEGEHDARRSRLLAHRLRTRGDDRGLAAAVAGASWASCLAEALARWSVSTGAAGKTVAPRLSAAATPRSAGHPGYLNSWLLGPLGA